MFQILDTIGGYTLLALIVFTYMFNLMISGFTLALGKGNGSIYRYYMNKFIPFGDVSDSILNAVIFLVMLTLSIMSSIHAAILIIPILFYVFTYCLVLGKFIKKIALG